MCVELRSVGYEGEILLIGSERHAPYNRPPLTKHGLLAAVDTNLGIDFEALGVDCSLGESALALDRERRRVQTDRREISYDTLVLATGAEPISLPGPGAQLCVRTSEDAERARMQLVPSRRVVVIGAGWIGAEIASAALTRGCHVTCLEGAAAPLASQFGEEVAARFLPWWRDVNLLTRVRVAEVVADGVILADGDKVLADVIIASVGVRPATDWLADSGLARRRGAVVVDERRRSSDPNIFAIGDCAIRWSPRYGAWMPGGHWDEAVQGAVAGAGAIVGTDVINDKIPYLWSEQFGRRLLYVGRADTADRHVVRLVDDDPEKWGVAWLDDDNHLVAHLSVNHPLAFAAARRAIEAGQPVDERKLPSLDIEL
ncbi:NADPH-dependent 2,4-dienoyl-CoA reductase, sulfur reductase [Pseudonocardia oroxyli]|uniref:NADPH-dependent 2,4-dienoyl-CoA reductase, sulfur reductase n=2 Tax=Pseudonocardia oroxyli TaxID=366584 RepID=A0A1G8EX78_PSEOR|nr:NADPH-dependent 2,4-dienoyl-CoA reductase, sulfur reductase [Pseudonocardia oroxyli]